MFFSKNQRPYDLEKAKNHFWQQKRLAASKKPKTTTSYDLHCLIALSNTIGTPKGRWFVAFFLDVFWYPSG